MTNPDASKLLPGSGRGAHEFLVLDPYPVLASNRDPLSFDYGQRPSGDAAAYVTNHSGGQTVTPARYMDVVAALRPDIYITLCDEVRDGCKCLRAAAHAPCCTLCSSSDRPCLLRR